MSDDTITLSDSAPTAAPADAEPAAPAPTAAPTASATYRITHHPDGTAHVQYASTLLEAYFGPAADAEQWIADHS